MPSTLKEEVLLICAMAGCETSSLDYWTSLNDVHVEPPLQEIKTKTPLNTGNAADGARLDIRAKSFWRNGQDSYCDKPSALSATAMKCSQVRCTTNTKKKKRMYNHRVMSIEQGTFTPECKVFLKSLFRKIAVKLWFLVLKLDLKSPPPPEFFEMGLAPAKQKRCAEAWCRLSSDI